MEQVGREVGQQIAQRQAASYKSSWPEYLKELMTPTLRTGTLFNIKPSDWQDYCLRWNIVCTDLGLVTGVAIFAIYLFTLAWFSIFIEAFLTFLTLFIGHLAWYLLLKRGGCMGAAGNVVFIILYAFSGFSHLNTAIQVKGLSSLALIPAIAYLVPNFFMIYALLGQAGFLGGQQTEGLAANAATAGAPAPSAPPQA